MNQCYFTSILFVLALAEMFCVHVEAFFRQLDFRFEEEQPVGTVVGSIPASYNNNSNGGGDNTIERLEMTSLDGVRYIQRTENSYFRVNEETGDVICTEVGISNVCTAILSRNDGKVVQVVKTQKIRKH